MPATIAPSPQCIYCGTLHPNIICPRVKVIDYYDNGFTKRVELFSLHEILSTRLEDIVNRATKGNVRH